MGITVQLPPVLEYQHRALFGPERIAVVEGSTKCGKTYPCILWLLNELFRTGAENRAYWWVAPFYEQAKIAYRRTCEMLRQADHARTLWKSNEQELSIVVRGRGLVQFKSADKPDGLYGEDVFACVIDEASRCKEAAWHAVRSTLTATGGPVRVIGNVRGRKNWAYALARKAEAGAVGMTYSKITCMDAVKAGIITREEVESAQAELPDWVFRELYLSEPSEDGANPFGVNHIERCVRPMSSASPVAFGVDLAKSSDWTVVIGLDADGCVCVFDRWQRVPWQETQTRIAGYVRDVPALVDSTGVGDPIVERLVESCPRLEGFKFTAHSKQQLMLGLASAIQSAEVGFPDGPVKLELMEFEYVTSPGGRVQYAAAANHHDDCVCALALAVQCRTTTNSGFEFQLGGREPPRLSEDEDVAIGMQRREEYRNRFFAGD